MFLEPEDEIEAYTNDFVETTNPMLLPKLEDASAAALFCSSVHLALNRDFQKNGSTVDGDKGMFYVTITHLSK